ncbi:unnamed protein product [Aphanomyces euteiches]
MEPEDTTTKALDIDEEDDTSQEFSFHVGEQAYTSTRKELEARKFSSHEEYVEFIGTTFPQAALRSMSRRMRSSPVWKYVYKLDIPQLTKRKKMCEYVCIACLEERVPWEDCLLALFGNRPSNGMTHLLSKHKGLIDERKSSEASSPSTPVVKRKTPTKTTTNKKPKTVINDVISVHHNVKNCPALDETELLKTLVYPMEVEDFMATHYQKKALVVHPSTGVKRYEQLISSGMEDLNVEELMTSTSSEELQAWVRTRDSDGGKIESVKVESVKEASVLYAAGHSLYFQSSPEHSGTLIPALANDLGMGFTSTSIQGDVQGEIEIFCARAGHITNWHFDFMENFTVQLQGSKTWKLKKSSITYPVRGCTPHYKTQEVVEQQLKIHRLVDPAFEYNHGDPDEYEEITLTPGSMLYFPAGMWHRVECTEDSITMNLSMFPTPHADIVVDALRHLLLQSDKWRRGVCYYSPEEAQTNMAELLVDLKNQIDSLTAADIIPERLLIHGRSTGDESDDDEEHEEEEEDGEDESEGKAVHSHVLDLSNPEVLSDSSIEFDVDTLVRFNPLANVMHHTDIPAIHQSTGFEPDDEVFILNVGFGHSSYASALRLEFKVNPLQAAIVRAILARRVEKNHDPFSLKSLVESTPSIKNKTKKSDQREIQVALHFLCHAGFLTVVDAPNLKK